MHNVVSLADSRATYVQPVAAFDSPDEPHELGGRSPGATRLATWLASLAAFEFVILALAAYVASVAYYLAFHNQWAPVGEYVPAALLISAMILLISLAVRNFGAIRRQSRLRFVWSGLGSVCLTFFFFLSAMFVFKVSESYSRGVFFCQLFTVAFSISLLRAFAYGKFSAAMSAGRVETSRLVVIGNSSVSDPLLKSLMDEGAAIVRVFPFPTEHESGVIGAKKGIDLQKARDLVAQCRASGADEVLMLPAEGQIHQVAQLANLFSELPVSIHVIPFAETEMFRRATVGELGNRHLTVQLMARPLTVFDRVVKRAFDLSATVAALFLLSPLLIIISAAIRLDSPGPALFRQKRHGYNNDEISVFKFRTMTVAEPGDPFRQATKSDPRITRIGRILRRTNIDELPQLFNVLLGEMSIVGPRPHPVALNEQYERLLNPFMRRHNTKPGITGWAQINGYRGETDTIEKMKRRLEYDLYYIDNWSFLFDLQIIVLTLFSKKAYVNAY